MSKKIIVWLSVAVSLILIGAIIFVGVMTVFKWNFKKLSTVEYVTKSYEITEDFKNIFIDTKTTDIEFLPSEDNKTIVECYELKDTSHSVKVVNDTLEITPDDKPLHFFIGINVNTPKITVYIPEREYNQLTLRGTTGDAEIPKDFKFGSMDIKVTTGDISSCAIVNESVKIKATTGDIKLKDVIAKQIEVKATTGNITLEKCDADELYLKATTGDVKGSLLTNKTFVAKATTGSVSVPQSTTGGKCEIKVTTGDIKIEIEK